MYAKAITFNMRFVQISFTVIKYMISFKFNIFFLANFNKLSKQLTILI